MLRAKTAREAANGARRALFTSGTALVSASAAVTALIVLAGCAPASRQPTDLSSEQIATLEQAVRRAAQSKPASEAPPAASDGASGRAVTGSTSELHDRPVSAQAPPGTEPTPAARGEGGAPSRAGAMPALDPATLEARAASALPPGLLLRSVEAAPGTAGYAIGLAAATSCASARCPALLLLDVKHSRGELLASHEFQGETDAADSAAGSSPTPERLGKIVPAASAAEPVLLVELQDASGETRSACGWWLRASGPMFVCAPKTIFASSYHAIGGTLVERWPTELPGRQSDPVTGEPSAGWTGRTLRFSGRGWEDVGQFRCLTRPLKQVLAETPPEGLSGWQAAASLPPTQQRAPRNVKLW